MEESSNTSMIACLAGGQPGLTETNNLLQGMQVQIANDWVWTIVKISSLIMQALVF